MISKEQWSGITNALGDLYCNVKFKMPSGEEITVTKAFVAENKLALIVWIDGGRADVWGWDEHKTFKPITKQVWRRKTLRPGAAAVRRISKIKGGKTYLKRKGNAYLFEVKEYWVPHFNTALSLVRQFRKIEGLELITPVTDAGRTAITEGKEAL